MAARARQAKVASLLQRALGILQRDARDENADEDEDAEGLVISSMSQISPRTGKPPESGVAGSDLMIGTARQTSLRSIQRAPWERRVGDDRARA